MSAGGQFRGTIRPLLKEILLSCVVMVMKIEAELNFWSDSLSLLYDAKIYVGLESVFYSLWEIIDLKDFYTAIQCCY